MKKIILLPFALMGFLTYGQQVSAITILPNLNIAVPYVKKNLTGFEKPIGVPVMNKQSSALAVAGIGITIYDLQTNNSVDDRIYYDSATGEVAGAWTFSSSRDPFNDRGTGYNYNDGSGWGAAPSTRIENERVGWPSLVKTASSEMIFSHTSSTALISNKLKYARRTTAGRGTWTFGNLTSLPVGILWPRATVGGSNGSNNQTIHVIAITVPEGNDGSIHKGLDGALIYYRSNDEGVTWNILDSLLPHQDTTMFFGFSGDSYAIDAKGNTVAIAVFNRFDPSFILKSTDGGNTWTQSIYLDNNLRDYDPTAAGSISDTNGDGIADTITTTDGAGDVLIDNNGLVHVFFGLMRYSDDKPMSDSSYFYFPTTNGLAYWNETLTDTIVTIAKAPDLDQDGNLGNNLGGTTGDGFGLYYASLSSFPNAGISSEGHIFLAFSAIHELLKSASNQLYRHIFLIHSKDNGSTWSSPSDMTASFFSEEAVFPSMARTVDDSIRIICQVDGEPGLHTRGDEDPASHNGIIYLTFPNSLRGIGLKEKKGISPLKAIFPNPASNELELNLNITKTGISTLYIVDALGRKVLQADLSMLQQGINRHVINIADLPKGVYLLNLIFEDFSFNTARFVVQ